MPGSKSDPLNRPEFPPAPAAFSCSAHEGVFSLPVVKNIHWRSLFLRAISIFLFLLQFAAFATGARAQGFGLSKKTVKLQRKMPATVHLPGPGFDVQVNAHDANNADSARMLSDLLTTELQKYDKKLQVKATSPDEVVHCTIMTFQIPAPADIYCRRDYRSAYRRSMGLAARSKR